jgi:hypothetical protein
MSVSDGNWHFYSISKWTDTIVCIDWICESTWIDSTLWISSPTSINLNWWAWYGFGEFIQWFIIDELRMNSVSYTKAQLEQAYIDSN